VKARHAAALALLGWYFMLPPLAEGGASLNLNAPIGSWKIYQSFDLADQCERALLKYQRVGFQKFLARGANDSEKVVGLSLANGQCIATDDPRLAK
jgi:hypothetical protein